VGLKIRSIQDACFSEVIKVLKNLQFFRWAVRGLSHPAPLINSSIIDKVINKINSSSAPLGIIIYLKIRF